MSCIRENASRRDFLRATTLAAAGVATGCKSLAGANEIIDCHTHFYDPTRPQGVPWPRPAEKQLYRRVLPGDYKAIATPFGVTGTVVVEASAWVEDNQWVLDLAEREPFIKGLVGNLSPGTPEFPMQVKRFARNPLFRGIRVSFGDVPKLDDPARLRDLRVLAEHDLSLDLNGGVEALPVVEMVARTIPGLRVVVNHVSNLRIDGNEPPLAWRDGMRRVAEHPNTFCKGSGLVEGSGRRNAAPRDLEYYRPVLDYVWRCFGDDRVIYGSNWPVSELFAEFATVHGIVVRYVAARGGEAQRKFFCDNSRAAYKWISR